MNYWNSHRMTVTGFVLIYAACAVSLIAQAMPVFEDYRPPMFWYGMLFVATLGAAILIFEWVRTLRA